MKAIDMIAQRIGMLTVKTRVTNNARGRTRFLCQCDCGNERIVSGDDLRTRHTQSCGCYRRMRAAAAFTTHGHTKRKNRTSEYGIWTHMKTRCYNECSQFYHRYGGRGISMDPKWRDSFEAFFADMGPRPSPRHSIDRKNNDGGYTLNNCRWASPIEQASNKSSTVLLEYSGITDTIAGWSRRTGIPYMRLRRRLVDGWEPARALNALGRCSRAQIILPRANPYKRPNRNESKDAAVRAKLMKP